MNETVTFTFDFSSEFTKDPPQFYITHNNVKVYDVTSVTDHTIAKVKINLPIDTVEECILKVHRIGFDGINEQLFKINKVNVDSIDLQRVLYKSKFYPEYPEPWITEQRNNGHNWPDYHYSWLNLGWNGVWMLEYKTPIYTWLLENV